MYEIQLLLPEGFQKRNDYTNAFSPKQEENKEQISSSRL